MKYTIELSGWIEMEVEANSRDEAEEAARENFPDGWDCEIETISPNFAAEE